HVLELDHREQPVGQVEAHAVLQIVRRDLGHATTSSLGALVRTWQPSSVTTTVSSMRTPPCSARYTPGSTVTTWPAARTSVEVEATRGASWISRPTPCPVPWMKASPHPASPMTARHVSSTSRPRTPAFTAATPSRWL